VDFDVIYSALHLIADKSSDSFWASVALDIEAFDLVLLPGTLFELVDYIKKRESRAGLFDTQITRAFLSAFETTGFRQDDVISYYFVLVSALNLDSFKTGEHYVMLSNANSMKRLYAHITVNTPQTEVFNIRGRHEVGMVWQPRYASIHQILHLAGQGSLGARAL